MRAALTAGDPVISVDTKEKELVGDFKNAGRAWRPQGEPGAVRVHEFLIKELGRAVTYGIYDLMQCGLSQCWHKQRHLGVCGADNPPLVA